MGGKIKVLPCGLSQEWTVALPNTVAGAHRSLSPSDFLSCPSSKAGTLGNSWEVTVAIAPSLRILSPTFYGSAIKDSKVHMLRSWALAGGTLWGGSVTLGSRTYLEETSLGNLRLVPCGFCSFLDSSCLPQAEWPLPHAPAIRILYITHVPRINKLRSVD